MERTSKAEQLRLPEQLYILLVNPDTGEPRFAQQRVEQVLATAIAWELLDSGAIRSSGTAVSAAQEIAFPESYLKKAARIVSSQEPVHGFRLVMEIAAEMHPIWTTIGEDMVAKHLLTHEVQTRFMFFHRSVLTELTEAKTDGRELSDGLAQAARNLWNSGYDDELALTHPRLLARLVILDNHGLLEPLVGACAYDAAAPHIPSLRSHLRQFASQPGQSKPSSTSLGSSDDSGSYMYDSGSHFWIDGDSVSTGPDDYGSHGSSASDGHHGHGGGYGDYSGDGGHGHSGHGHDGGYADGGHGHGGHDAGGHDSGGHDGGGHDAGGHDGGSGDSGGGGSDGGGCGGCGGCGG